MMLVSYKFQCQHCDKDFKSEKLFIKHKCNALKRFEASKTIVGQNAFNFYCKWLRKYKNARAGIELKSYLKSRYYLSFMRLAQFFIDVKIANPDMFIAFMVSKGYEPTLWIKNKAYVQFIEHMDRKVPVKKLIEITANTIMDESDELHVKPSDFFANAHPSLIIELLECRRLTPWILLHSSSFKIAYKNKFNDDQRYRINTFLNIKIWNKKFQDHPRIVSSVKKIVNALGI